MWPACFWHLSCHLDRVRLGISRLLLGLPLAFADFSAGAAAINFGSLSIEQGFNPQRDFQGSCGFLSSLTFNNHVFTPDINSHAPTDFETTVHVVGILRSIEWAGGVADPIILHAMVSTQAKQLISLYTHQLLHNSNVSFNFRVYSYDPIKKNWYEAFRPAEDQALSGRIEKDGTQYLFSIVDDPGTEVQSPENWEFTISILPAPLSQQLVYRTDSTHSVVKQFGVAGGNAPALSGVGTANLSYHSATLQATVNPGDAATGANFHYGLSPSLSSWLATPINALGNGGSDVAFSSPISNLTAGTTWYYQVIATNSVGSTTSSITSFNTVPLPSPQINAVNQQGSNLSLAGGNGASNTTFYVLAGTNLSISRSNWIVLATNQFDASGNFNCILTNAISPASRAMFYQLQSPTL